MTASYVLSVSVRETIEQLGRDYWVITETKEAADRKLAQCDVALFDLVDGRDYLAFMAVEPMGEERADLRNALLCHVLTALHAKKPVEVADFLPRWWQRSKSTEGGSDGG